MLVIAVSFFIGPAAADEVESRCAELADARAAALLEEENYALEQRTMGPLQGSEVQRQLLEADARAYREEVYRDCLRRAERATGEGEGKD